MDDIDKKIDEYNPNNQCKILIYLIWLICLAILDKILHAHVQKT